MEQHVVEHNKAREQFELRRNGHTAELVYRMRGNTMYFMHTWVPEAINGKGVAVRLTRAGLEHARNNGLKIAILCPFVATYVERHPEYKELQDPGFPFRVKPGKHRT